LHNFTHKNKRHREMKKEKGEEIMGKDKEMEKEVKARKEKDGERETKVMRRGD